MNSNIRFSWMAVSLWLPLFVLAQPSVLEPYDVYSCAGMIEYREAHQLAVLDPVNDFDQSWVLTMGGSDGDQTLATAELGILSPDSYAPDYWEPTESMSTPRQDFVAVSWGGVFAIAIGGFDGNQVLSSTEIYNAETQTWSPGPELITPRTHHRAVKLDEDRVLITGGFDGNAETASCEILNLATGTSEAVAPMNLARASHTLVWSGSSLMAAGGFNAAEGYQLADCEFYRPDLDLWTETGELPVARDNHAAVSSGLFPIVTGGRVFNAEANLFEGLAEGAWYDPEGWNWVAFDMASPHSYHGMGKRNLSANGISYGAPWWCMGGVDESGVGVETTFGVAELGTDASNNWAGVEWLEGPLGTGQNPDLLNGRYKAAMVETDAGWVVTGGDAAGIGTCAVVVGPLANVEDAVDPTGLVLYPNPAVGRVAIQGVGAQEAWTLRDAAGRTVRQGAGHQMDVSGLSTGTYLFQASERPSVRLQVQARD